MAEIIPFEPDVANTTDREKRCTLVLNIRRGIPKDLFFKL